MTGLLLAVALTLTLAAGVPIGRLHTASPLDRTDAQIVADALPRLTFLREAMDHGAGEDMQQLFPEGYFFLAALYGITWLDVGHRAPEQRERARDEARWALRRLDSAAGRAPFDPQARPPYGVFHAGWSTWLRAGLVLNGDDGQRARLATDAQQLSDAFTASETPFLSAYPGQSWPVDSVVGIAALNAAGKALGRADWRPTIASWRRKARTHGLLLPHQTDPATGATITAPRATSQTVLLRFLYDVDPQWATQAYKQFTANYTANRAKGVREYPNGTDQPGDVDSGPLIAGMSASASVVALGDAVVFGDRKRAGELTGLAEATGFAVTYQGKRRYLGGRLPIGDAFLAWSLTARPWISDVQRPYGSAGLGWRWPFYYVALAVLVPLWMLTVAAVRWTYGRPARSTAPRGLGPRPCPSG